MSTKVTRKYRKRRKWIGQKGGYRLHTKLTREQVVEIWALLYEKQLSQREIAEKYNVTQETISHIATGTRWNSVTGLPRRTKGCTTPPPSGALQGRPRGSKKVSLRKPRKADMKKLTDACVSAILHNEQYLTIKLSSAFKAPDSWPRMQVVEAEYSYKIYKVIAKKLLAWLYENKYTMISVAQVDKVIKDFGLFAVLSANGLDKDLLQNLI